MYLSELRQLAQLSGLRETKCRACPPEDWAPACSACGGSTRVWVSGDLLLSDEQLAQIRRGRRAEAARA